MISPSRRVPSWRVLLVLVLLAASFPWAQWRPGPSRLSSEPNGYYAQLTEAFLAGQLHLKAPPDPRLEALANPYAGDQGVPRPWDVTYFNHRFYLYFGTPPVFLLFAPFHLLTGLYLEDGVGTACFGLVGFALGAWWLLRLRARLFPGLGENWVVAGLAVWGLAGHAQLLAHTNTVYAVPINCASACLMAAVVFCTLAWENPGRLRWLVLGGLAWGLAIAARPNYLFSLGGLLAFLAGVLMRDKSQPVRQPRTVATLLAAGLPVLSVGCALAAYNWARFHSITEFGSSYMLIAGDQRHVPLLAWSRLAAGLHNTLLAPVDYSPYFPFAAPVGRGLLPVSPFLALVLALPVLCFSRPAERPFWRVGGTALFLAAAGNLLTVCLLQTQEDRYFADYLPAIALLSVPIGWSLAQALAGLAGWTARIGRIALGLAAGITLLHAAAGNIAFLNLPEHTPRLSRWLDYPTHWIESGLGYRYGPLQLRGRLPARPMGTRLPLVVTGRGQDVLYVHYAGPDQVQFGFFHAGAGGPEAMPFPLDLAQEHLIEIDLGSLYPPPEHPLFADRPAREIRLLQQRVRVTVDGRVALDGACDFYPTHPGDLHLGENPRGLVTGPIRLDLSGFQIKRLGLPAGPPVALHPLKPVRLEIAFPPFVHRKQEPLISTGRKTAGDLLYVVYVGPNQLRFAHDSPGAGSIESRIVDYEPGRAYVLEVDMGSLHPQQPGATVEAPLRVQLDGESIMAATRPFYPGDATELAFGYNAIGSSATYPLFTGEIRKITSIDALTGVPQAFGPVRCTVQFPRGRDGRAEPLVVSGRPGAGDFVYIVYAGGNTIRVGYDHWGAGGPVSEPLKVNYDDAHVLEISMGSLWPQPEEDAAWLGRGPDARRQLRETVSIRLNGRTVLELPAQAYPARPAEVFVGTNPLGGSSCGPGFTGRILHVERPGPGEPAQGDHP